MNCLILVGELFLMNKIFSRIINLHKVNMSSSNPICSIMDANCLTSLNFTNSLINLKILLKLEHIVYIFEGDDRVDPTSHVSKDEVWEY